MGKNQHSDDVNGLPNPDRLGKWGEFDPGRQGDAAKFEYWGGDEATYNGMTPEEKAQYKAMLTNGYDSFLGGAVGKTNPDAVKIQNWIANVRKQHGQPAAPAAASAGGPASSYMQAATPNVDTPWGGQKWTQDANGQWTQSSTLGGELGGANDSLEAQYAQMLGKPMDDGSGARQQAIDAAYGQSTSRLDPQWNKRQDAQRTQLLNQGLDESSEGYKSAMQDFGQQRNDAYTSAMNAAIGQGTAAGDSVFRNNMAARQAPLQQMEALKALAQAQGHPELLNALIAQKNNEMGLGNMQMQQQADAMNGGMQLLGGLMKGISSYGSGSGGG